MEGESQAPPRPLHCCCPSTPQLCVSWEHSRLPAPAPAPGRMDPTWLGSLLLHQHPLMLEMGGALQPRCPSWLENPTHSRSSPGAGSRRSKGSSCKSWPPRKLPLSLPPEIFLALGLSRSQLRAPCWAAGPLPTVAALRAWLHSLKEPFSHIQGRIHQPVPPCLSPAASSATGRSRGSTGCRGPGASHGASHGHPTEHPMEHIMEHPMEHPMENPMENAMEHLMEHPLEHPMGHPINHPIENPMNVQWGTSWRIP